MELRRISISNFKSYRDVTVIENLGFGHTVFVLNPEGLKVIKVTEFGQQAKGCKLLQKVQNNVMVRFHAFFVMFNTNEKLWYFDRTCSAHIYRAKDQRMTIYEVSYMVTALVGHNGAGKTSILQAIDFVLAPERNKSKWKDVISVLASRTTEGFVELFFSCNDPIIANNIAIRKTFSLKECGKHCLYINGNKISRRDAMAMLEIFGVLFHQSIILNAQTVSNFTYYTPDQKLLYILKHLGSSVYESFLFIDKQFLFLEELKNKLDQLQMLSIETAPRRPATKTVERRKLLELKMSIIYNIIKQIKTSSHNKIQELESFYQTLEPEWKKSQFFVNIDGLKKSILQLQNFIKIHEDSLSDLLKEKEDLLRKNEKIMYGLNTVREGLRFLEYSLEHGSAQRKDFLKAERLETSEALKNIESTLKEKRSIITELEARLEFKMEQRVNLVSKLEKPVKLRREDSKYYLDKISSIDREIKKIEEELSNIVMKNEEYVSKKYELQSQIDSMYLITTTKRSEYGQKITQLKQEVYLLQEKLSELRRNEKITEDEIFDISCSIQSEALKLQKKVGCAIVKGCESVLRVVDNWKSSGNSLSDNYFGMVIENFKSSSGLNLAIETAIGKRLFYHIVLDNGVGTKILEEMKINNLPGEVWFIPLNVMSPTARNFPNSKFAEPILKKLEYSERFSKVMEFLFGNILICSNIESATNFAKMYGFTCITVQGDRVSRNCDLYGGYFDPNRNSIKLFSAINDLQSQYTMKQDCLEKLKYNITTIESKLVKAITNIQQLKASNINMPYQTDTNELTKQLQNLEGELSANEKIMNKKTFLAFKLQLNKNKIMEEMTGDLEGNTDAITQEIRKLNREINELKKCLNDSNLKVLEFEQERIKLQDKLNLQSMVQQFQEKDNLEKMQLNNKIIDYNTKQLLLNNHLSRLRKDIDETKKKIKEAHDKKYKNETDLQELLDSQGNYFPVDIQKITNKIEIYSKTITDHNDFLIYLMKKHNIVALTSFQKYSELSKSMLFRELKKVQDDLTFLENENTEDLYKNGSSSELCIQVKKLENYFSINYVFFSQFVDWLCHYINGKLDSVSSHFTYFLNKISEGGEGYLFADDDGSSNNSPELLDLTGINIYVNFPNTGETWNLSNLSNGQRVCVLIALSLACISSSCGPLCIYDEIDKALTAGQRSLLNQEISCLGQSLQVLSSAHSFEEASASANVFSVEIMNMISTVKKVIRNES